MSKTKIQVQLWIQKVIKYAFLPFPFFWSHIFKKGDRLVEIRFEETFSIYLCFHEIDKISFQQYLLTTKCQILTLKHQYGAGNEYDLFISFMCYVRYVASYVRMTNVYYISKVWFSSFCLLCGKVAKWQKLPTHEDWFGVTFAEHRMTIRVRYGNVGCQVFKGGIQN